jgi:hypothetical protein
MSRNLKGSRKLQFGFPTGTRFGGGIATGTSAGGGTVNVAGDVKTTTNVGIAEATGTGDFTSNSGSSGFINTVFGSSIGSSAAGGTGSQNGIVDAMKAVTGTAEFEGTTTTSGNGGFGAGFSPVQFNTVVTEVPGTAIPATFGSPKKGGTTGGGFNPSTFVTTVTPVSTGPTGGFGFGSGGLDIASTTTGTIKDDNTAVAIGTGSITGGGTSFGGGMGTSTNFFGTAGGLGSGAGTIGATATGTSKDDQTNGIFTGTGGATGNFNNQGQGIFGNSNVIAFP